MSIWRIKYNRKELKIYKRKKGRVFLLFWFWEKDLKPWGVLGWEKWVNFRGAVPPGMTISHSWNRSKSWTGTKRLRARWSESCDSCLSALESASKRVRLPFEGSGKHDISRALRGRCSRWNERHVFLEHQDDEESEFFSFHSKRWKPFPV